MPMNNIGDRVSRPADDAVGFDSRGYVLTAGDDGANTVKKAADGDDFLGVNYRSTLDLTDDEVLTGREVAVQLDGRGPVLAAPGVYELGDEVLVDSANHEAGVVSTGGGGSKVGTVVDAYDTSDESEPTLIQVDYVGQKGNSSTTA